MLAVFMAQSSEFWDTADIGILTLVALLVVGILGLAVALWGRNDKGDR